MQQTQKIVNISTAPNSNSEIAPQLKGFFYIAINPGAESGFKNYLQGRTDAEFVAEDKKGGLVAVYVTSSGLRELSQTSFVQKDNKGSALVHSKDGIPVVNFELNRRVMGLDESAPVHIAS